MTSQTAQASTNIALPPAYRLGEYVIESVLGQGGFGITYLARDTKLSSRVAIKEYFPQAFAVRDQRSTIISRGGEASENYNWGLQEFLKEARALAKFKHNHIVRVLRFIEANGTAYMVMEYEQGESLAQYLRKSGGFLNEPTLLSIFLPILSGLQAVHDAGLLHLDIKPENIYLRTNGQPMLIDFGSARKSKSRSAHDQKIALTPGYAALEHYPGYGKQGPWTDVYSIGATLYRCTTGEEPTSAIDRYQSWKQKKVDPLRPATTFERPLYAAYIRECTDWALKLSPKERPRTAYALQRGIMGHGMSNDPHVSHAAGVNLRSGFIGIPKVATPKEEPKGISRSMLERTILGLVIVAAFGVLSAIYLVQTGVLTRGQLYDGMYVAQTSAVNKVRRLLGLHTTETTTAHAPRRVQPDNTRRVDVPFSADKKLERTLVGHHAEIRSLAFLQDGHLLASSFTDGATILWNVETGTEEQTLPVSSTAALATSSADGRWLATTREVSTITLWDAKTKTLEGRLDGHSASIVQMLFSPDGRTLVSIARDGTMTLWDTQHRKIRQQIAAVGDVQSMTFARDSRRFATGDVSGQIKYWETRTGKLMGYFQAYTDKITALAFSPDDRWLASGGPGKFLKLWDTGLDRNDRLLTDAPDTVSVILFSPNGKSLIVGGSDNIIQLRNVDSGDVVDRLSGNNPSIRAIALSSDGTLLASGGEGGAIQIWE